MFDYLFRLSDIKLFILLSCGSVLISIITIFIVKRCIPLELRYKDNPVTGNVGSIISLIYGVLAGLTALYLINNISYTADAVQHEANAIAGVYRDSQWLKEPTRSAIETEIKSYLNKVITVEWALMKNGTDVDKQGDYIIKKMNNMLHVYPIVNNSELLIMHDMIEEMRMLYDARQQRIQMSFSELSPEIWVVLLIGTILTIAINFLFGMNFYLHILTASAAALMASSMVFLLVTLDRPFQGDFVIESDAYKSVLTFIEKNDGVPSSGNVGH